VYIDGENVLQKQKRENLLRSPPPTLHFKRGIYFHHLPQCSAS
jgi:hypothetical protein